jgi:hypothetical protein
MDDDWAWQLWQFEMSQVRYQADPLPGQAAFRYRPGSRPVLISAPHGARHWRQDYWKWEEEYTASLANLLAEQTGAYALYTVRRIRPDPNYEDDSDYKRLLANVLQEHEIRLVLDLHGAWSGHEFGLELGTIDSRSCPDYETTMIQSFAAQHFEVDSVHFLDRLWVNCYFKGGAQQRTVTRFVWEQCGVNAAQLEINAYLRMVYCNPNFEHTQHEPYFAADPIRQRRVINALINIIQAV